MMIADQWGKKTHRASLHHEALKAQVWTRSLQPSTRCSHSWRMYVVEITHSPTANVGLPLFIKEEADGAGEPECSAEQPRVWS